MLKRVKQLTLGVARAGGVLAPVRDSRWRARRLLILCYHGISLEDEHEWNPALYMSSERFSSRMSALRSGGYVQLHTHRHRTPLDSTKFARELVDNRAENLSSIEFEAWLSCLGQWLPRRRPVRERARA